MRPKIAKTTITFTVLHLASDPLPDDLLVVLEETNTGHAVGWTTDRKTVEVPDSRVVTELVALGNDGSFFDDDCD
jgi:hypothetical protein